MGEKTPAGGVRLMVAARLIRGISNGLVPEGIYENAVYSYGIIAGALKDGQLVGTISEAAGVPREKVLSAAQKIIELLLWNRQDNPFTSLGLSPFATIEEIHGRWQRLIAIYHPDRHMDDPRSEEIAKKINEAYKRACQIKSSAPRKIRPPIAPVSPAGRGKPEGFTGKFRGRKNLTTPQAIVLIAVALLVFFFILLFLGGREQAPSSTLEKTPGDVFHQRL